MAVRKQLTEAQRGYVIALVMAGAEERWVGAAQIQIHLARAGRKISLDTIHKGLTRLMWRLEELNEEDRLLSGPGLGYRLVERIAGTTPAEQLRDLILGGLNEREHEVVETIVRLGGVGRFVSRRKIEDAIAWPTRYVLRHLEYRLNQVNHEFRVEIRSGRGYRLWPRNDPRWYNFR